MKTGIVFVITAPSGCGKGSLRQLALSEDAGVRFCPSLTTRPPRVGEVDGEDYFFVSREEFFNKKTQGELIEWAEVYGHYYGTTAKGIRDCLSAGQDIMLEKDVQGARTLRRHFPDGVFVFVLPPSFRELQRRIESRGTEGIEHRRLRLESAKKEMADLSTYDYVIINADLHRAKDRLMAIFAGERARVRALATPLQRRAPDDKSTRGPGGDGIQIQPSCGCRQKGEADSLQRGAASPRAQAGNRGPGGDKSGENSDRSPEKS